MATIRAYTTIEQSRKLAEILPLESADMCYPYDRHLNKMYGDIPYVMGYKRFNEDTDFPCWSLSALLDVIPKCIGDYNTFRIDINDKYFSIWYDENLWYYEIGCGVNNKLPDITMKEPIDACYDSLAGKPAISMVG